MTVVGYEYLAAHHDTAADHNAFYRRDMHVIGETNAIANCDCRREMLRLVGCDSLQPEVTICKDAPAKGNMASANDPAARSKIQARSLQGKGHGRAGNPSPS